jgi:tetratricopeptide (TPR) repeat protein
VFSLAPADRLAMAADVLADLEALEDRTLISRTLADVTWAFDPCLRGPRWDQALELLASTTDRRNARGVYILNRCRGNAAVLAADGEAFRAIVRANLPLLDQLSEADRSIQAAQSGHVAIWDGDLVRAGRQYEETLHLGRREFRDTAFGNFVFASVLLGWLRGDLSPARAAAAELHAELGGPNTEAVHMWVELACGNREPATQFFASFGERHRRVFRTSVICGQGLAAATLAALALGDRAAMRAVEDILVELDADVYTSGPPPALAVAYYRGILAHGLGDLDRAAVLLDHSLAVHRRLSALPYVAASHAALAAVRAEQGRHDEARRLATAALETAERVGASGIARQARSAIERSA